jgi:hypoxanthine-DNA glycosylase
MPKRIHSFAPVVGEGSRVLILGSMPGVKSLAEQRYYAHPRNAFWPIVSVLFAIDLDLDYDERIAALPTHGVALWDVLASCERRGSLDSAIVSERAQANPIAAFLASHPSIEAICFNGHSVQTLFERHVRPSAGALVHSLRHLCLPSTSPANARLNLEQKLAQWHEAFISLGMPVSMIGQPT